jgi:transcriptional regulator with XRE-family HTH domain
MTAKPVERRRGPRNDEEAAAFKRLGRTITAIRERRDMGRDDLASKAEMTVEELEVIERGELDERWGDLRMIAKGLDTTLSALFTEAEAE